MHRAEIAQAEMPHILTEATANCGRLVSSQEIASAIVASDRLLKGELPAEPRTPRCGGAESRAN